MEQCAEYLTAPDAAHHGLQQMVVNTNYSDMVSHARAMSPCHSSRSSSSRSSLGIAAPRSFSAEEQAVLKDLYERHSYARPWSRRASAAPSAAPLDLPIGLSILYYTAQDVRAFNASPSAATKTDKDAAPITASSDGAQQRKDKTHKALSTPASSRTPPAAVIRAERLSHFLESVAHHRALARRQAEIHRAKKAEAQRCAVLYTLGLTKRERAAQWAEAYKTRRAEEELAQCTFTPQVTSRAARLPPKGLDTFMEKCVEWEEEARRRTLAKYQHYAKQDEAIAERTSPHMSRGSRQLIEAAAKGEGVRPGGPLDVRRPLWDAPASRTAESEESGSPAHVPVTSALEKRSLTALKHLLQSEPVGRDGSTSQARHHCSADSTPMDQGTSTLTVLEATPSEKGKTVAEYLARVAQDQERRAVHAERLRQKYTPLLIEPTTGQPFFTPNAMPTVERGDGKRVPFDQLSPEEQETMLTRLKRQNAAYALVKYFRQQQARRGTLVGPGEGRHASIVDRADVEASRKQRNLERIRAEQQAECTFQPRISASSERIALRKTNGRRIYERPQVLTQRERADREKQERPLYVSTSATKMQKMMDRSDLWLAGRAQRLHKARQAQREKELEGCTFTPQRITAHGGANVEQAPHSGSRSLHETTGSNQSDVHGGPLGPRRLGPTARRRSTVLSDAALHNLSVSADVRLMNEVEMLRTRSAINDPTFLDSVLSAYHAQGASSLSGTTSGAIGHASLDRSCTVDLSGRADVYVTPRRPERATHHSRQRSPASMLEQASPKVVQQLLSNLTLRNAPRLPDSVAVDGWHRAYPDDDDEAAHATQLQSFSLSPVRRTEGHPHAPLATAPSLSPNRADMMAALERMDTAQGSEEAFVVQRPPAPARASVTARSPWPPRLRDATDEQLQLGPRTTHTDPKLGLNASPHSGSSTSGDEIALTSQLDDPWAALDAQTDAILLRRELNRSRSA